MEVFEGQFRPAMARRIKRNQAPVDPGGTNRLLSAKANGELHSYLPCPKFINSAVTASSTRKRAVECSKKYYAEDAGAWLRAHMLALDTPYLTGYLLRQVTEVVSLAG
ncbi:MAG: hypothetical protein H5U02_03950 [Clostridia bacterium]|nr:hypothetical protein [Clostridia bacterium]